MPRSRRRAAPGSTGPSSSGAARGPRRCPPAAEVDVGELHHAATSRSTEGLECPGVLLAGLRVADPHEAEGHDSAEHGRGVRRLPRRVEAQVSPSGHRRAGIGHREVELGAHGARAGHVQLELELGHDAEVAAATAQPPEQLGVLLRRGAHDLAIRGDQLERDHVVAGQSVLAGEPAHAAAQGQPTHTRVRDVAGRGGHLVRLGRRIERTEQSTSLDPCSPVIRVDAHAAHRGQVDHQTALGNRQPDDAVPAAANPDLQALLPRQSDSTYDVLRSPGSGRPAQDADRPWRSTPNGTRRTQQRPDAGSRVRPWFAPLPRCCL